MNFNKNKRNKEQKNSRFSDLKTESNPFKSNNNSRDNSRDNSRNRSNSNTDGSYVPPSRKGRERGREKNRGNSFKGRNRRYTGVAPPVKEKVLPKIAPNVNDEESFPTLAPPITKENTNSSWSKKLEIAEKDENEIIEEKCESSEDESECVVEEEEGEKSWATIIKYQDPKVKKDDPKYIKPGWVRLSRCKKTGRFVHEYGEQRENPFYKELMEMRKRQIQMEWDKRMQEYEEYDEVMGYSDNYYYSWQADEIDAERELEARIARMEEEWEQEDNASDDDYSDEYDDYDY